jgi:hypothetical protein
MYHKGKHGSRAPLTFTANQRERDTEKRIRRAATDTPAGRERARRDEQRKRQARIAKRRAEHKPRSSWWSLPFLIRKNMVIATKARGSQASQRSKGKQRR